MRLIGHAEAVNAFHAAATGARLHHAWLLAGPAGIGKARFAEVAARWLLAGAADPTLAGEGLTIPAAHRTAALIAAGSHPDYRRLARLPRDKSEDLARAITVDQVRALQSLFATTPSLSPARVVVIDAIDELERGAANALLKNLEEPPAGTTFLLVSHAPGRLLPTIRSRCRLLRFGRLTTEETAAVLREALPEADAGEIEALARIADGAPGSALRFAGLDIATLDAALETLAREGDATNARRIALARSLSAKAAQPRYEAFLERVPSRLAAAARAGEGRDAISLWARARAIAESAVRLSLDPQLTVLELAGLVAALGAQEGTR